MSSIQPINNTYSIQHKPLITTSNTGFIALGGMGLATASAITKNKSIRKHHKQFAYLAGILTLFHLATAIHTNLKFKNSNSKY